MPSIFRISRGARVPVVDVGSPTAIEDAVRATKPGHYHVDEISADPLPSGHTARRWGTAIKHPDGTVSVEPDPWQD